MKIFKDKHALRKEILKTKGTSFVPTMGGLHKGHISLIKQSKKSKFKTLVSIFVNPKQFNKKSDFKSYPRNTKKDIKLLKKLKINYLYIPTFKVIYGFKPKNKVFLDKSSKKLCGKFRKGHFEGVLNVVNRFIEIIKPRYIFLGIKDYQQLYLIKKHIEKLFAENISTPISDMNREQALLPSSAKIFKNHYGTASGMWFSGKNIEVIALPGVPYEMKSLMEKSIIPELKNIFEFKSFVVFSKFLPQVMMIKLIELKFHIVTDYFLQQYLK